MSKIIHRGLRYDRTRHPNGGLEKAFADAWEKQAPKVLGNVIGAPPQKPAGWLFTEYAVYSQRDAQIAAEVIQWLGTHVGSGFLAGVLRTDAAKSLLRWDVIRHHPDLCAEIVDDAKRRIVGAAETFGR